MCPGRDAPIYLTVTGQYASRRGISANKMFAPISVARQNRPFPACLVFRVAQSAFSSDWLDGIDPGEFHPGAPHACRASAITRTRLRHPRDGWRPSLQSRHSNGVGSPDAWIHRGWRPRIACTGIIALYCVTLQYPPALESHQILYLDLRSRLVYSVATSVIPPTDTF